MGESAKRRKSLWDAQEETPNGPDYQACGALKADDSWKSQKNTGWSYGDDPTGAEEFRKENDHYKSMSPAFDRWGRRSNSHSPNNGRNQSRRYTGRGRSRSRSRSRSQSRGRREGRSRSRSRGRDRFRGWNKSRSRDRDRNRDSMRGQNRSRSPPHNSKRDPYALGDRRSGPHVSSQVCRDFTAGKCRRGSDCRFYHSDSVDHRARGHSEDNLSERLGSRPERGHVSRYTDSEGPGYQSRDSLSNMHHMEDDFPRNRSRGTIVCRDFVKGKCRWGASCKFSHDSTSSDNDRGTRTASFDHGQDNQSSRTGKSLCKYFAAGKCFKDNCRFSHDATPSNVEVRPSDDVGSHRFDDKNNWLNGPRWDDAGRPSDLIRTTEWNDCVRKDTDVSVPTDRTSERRGHSFENENRAWGSTEPKFTISGQERGISPHRETAGNFSALNTSEVIQKFVNAEEIHLTPQTSEPQNIGRTSAHVLGHNINKEASGIILSTSGTHPYGSASSYLPPQGLNEDSIARTIGSNAVNEFMNARDSLHQVPLPGQGVSGTGTGMASEHSAGLNGAHASATHPFGSASSYLQPEGLNKDSIARTLGSNAVSEFMNARDSLHQVTLPGQGVSGTGTVMVSEHSTGLNGTHSNMFLHIPSNGHSKKEAPSTPEIPEFKVPQSVSSIVTAEQVDQMKTSPTSMMKKFEELQDQRQSVLNPPGPSGLPSNPISSLVNAIFAQANPEIRVVENYHPPDDIELSTSVNCKMPPDNSSYLDRESNKVPLEQKNESYLDRVSNKVPLEQLNQSYLEGVSNKIPLEQNQSSAIDPVLGNYSQIDGVKQQESKLVDATGKNKLAAEESQDGQENDHPGAVNVHGKVEEGSGNKDEKVMRLFKNALIEFVKEILKPTWKEGRMSREVHKTIVKKVVDKVTSTIQGGTVPKTQEKIEQYLSYSKAKITKLVQAYVERLLNEA